MTLIDLGDMLKEDLKKAVTTERGTIGIKGVKDVVDLQPKRDVIKQGINPLSKAEKQQQQIELQYAYEFILGGLRKYLDLDERYYNLIALWIIGTYNHSDFPSYPYLFLNAMRGSGKSRTLKLITYLTKDGSMLSSLTEAVLFRENNALAIDEFEGLGRKGTENLKELLNSAYKKGTKVKRMAKRKVLGNEEQVVDSFDVYRPIIMANIYGLVDEALKDRCITLILEKSGNKFKTNLIEMFEYDDNLQNAKELLCKIRLFHSVMLVGVYKEWNNYLSFMENNGTNGTNSIYTYNGTNGELFNKIYKSNLNGREIELCFPMFLIANETKTLDVTIESLKEIFQEKKDDEKNDNLDISLYNFITTLPESRDFLSQKELLKQYREFVDRNDDFLNDRWFGRRLTTLKLFKDKRRVGNVRYIVPDYKKAQEKMEMFK